MIRLRVGAGHHLPLGHEGEGFLQAGTPKKGGDLCPSGRCPFTEEMGVGSMPNLNQRSRYLLEGDGHGVEDN